MPFSHCGGIENRITLLANSIFEIGRALPPLPTKRPTSVLLPDRFTSSHDGRLVPAAAMVMSQPPDHDCGPARTLGDQP